MLGRDQAGSMQKDPASMFAYLPFPLRVLREMRGLSLTAAARAAGIGKSQLSGYENGKDLPKLDSLAKLLALLDVDPVALFYVVRLFERVQTGDMMEAELLGSSLGPAIPLPEQQAFVTLLQDIVRLFTSRVDEGLTAQIRNTHLKPKSPRDPEGQSR